MKKEYIILAIVILAAIFIRIYPTTFYDTPLKYDSYYHARVAGLMQTEGPLITQEPWPEDGRSHFYPPLYHMLLLLGSYLTFNSILDASKFILPFFAALIPLTAFWFVRKFRDNYTALIVAFLLAFNSFFLDASYDSPELLGFLLLPFIAYFLLKKDYLKSGLVLALSFMFNIFFGVFTTAAILIFTIYEGTFKKVYKNLFGPALAIFVLWNLPRIGELGHLDFTIGSSLISKSLGAWAFTYTPFIAGALLILYALKEYFPKKGYKPDRYVTFWSIWTIFFTVVFATFLISPAAYPWRMPLYISIGFSLLIADMISKVKFKNSIIAKATAVIILVGFITIPANIYLASGNLRPALDQNEYTLIDWLNNTINEESLVLSDSVFCSNILTLTNNKCALDINFESIPDKQKWIEYTDFFEFHQDAVSVGLFLEKYDDIDYVIYANKYSDRQGIEVMGEKIYASWECDSRTFTCFNSTAAYRVN